MGLVVGHDATPAFRHGTIEHVDIVELIDRGQVGKHRLQRHVVVGHDEGDGLSIVAQGNGLGHGIVDGVDHTQLFQLEARLSLHLQRDDVALGSLLDIRHHGSALIGTHGDKELLDRCANGRIDDLVDNHVDTIGGNNQIILTGIQGSRQLRFLPIVLVYLLDRQALLDSVDGEREVASLARCTVADQDVVLSAFLQRQLMAQGSSGIGARLHIAHAGEVGHILSPPASGSAPRSSRSCSPCSQLR